MTCDVLFDNDGTSPHDGQGCHLPAAHTGPHEFIATDGRTYQWETDWECDCHHCRQGEGDWCCIYWEKKKDA